MPKKGEFMDLSGQRFGRWLVIERGEPAISKSGKSEQRWLCKCDCGNELLVRQHSLCSGKSLSCGCLSREKASTINKTHGLSHKSGRIYPLWNSIKYRCYCETSKDYPNYGGRGIKMCDEWKDDFQKFYDWAINNGYKNGLTIDRINVDGNYEPSNCRFITNAEQAKNKRDRLTDEERYRICPICGKRYEVSQRKGTKTCSIECGIKLRELSLPKKKPEMGCCVVCRKEFRKRTDHGKDKIYCSTKCMGIGKSPVWEYKGEKLHVVEWAERTGINAHCLLRRKEMGWSIDRILSTPLRKKKRGDRD